MRWGRKSKRRQLAVRPFVVPADEPLGIPVGVPFGVLVDELF
jgi:hypothetical protein